MKLYFISIVKLEDEGTFVELTTCNGTTHRSDLGFVSVTYYLDAHVGHLYLASLRLQVVQSVIAEENDVY